MGHMLPDSSIDLDAPPARTVVEFGTGTAPARRRWSVAGLGRAVAGDRRLVPLSAALAAVAVLAALISEWQVTTVDAAFYGDGQIGSRLLATGVTDLGGLGAGFLVGLFPLSAALVLTMFGPPAGRRYLRLVGLSVGGTLLGLLAALAASLGGESRAIPRIYVLQLDESQLEVGLGRGLWCALAGVVCSLLALYLADRHLPDPAAPPGTPPDDAEATPEWTWRRPPAADEERRPAEPLELTVAPAPPFTARPDDHDKPS
jgi:MFS family permease